MKHIGMTREYLAQMIRQRGARFVDPAYDGTDDEAVAEVMAGPPIVATCQCPKESDGSCAGDGRHAAAEGRGA